MNSSTIELAKRSQFRRRSLVLIATLLIAPAAASAHPSVSVVIDSRGSVFYSDLIHVWRIAPNGTRSIAVRDVHTHELYLDSADNLYGEHLWYEGEASNKWGHRVWRRTADGRISIVIPATEGFLKNYSFVRDRTGSMYWAERGTATEIRRRSPDGRISVHSRGPFTDVGWIVSALDGTVYLIDSGALKRITPNGFSTTLSRSIAARSVRKSNAGPHHSVMGLWLDRRGNVYVAVFGAAVVNRITPRGEVTTVVRSRAPWAPTGGAFASNGDLWLMETTITNKVRVRRITPSGESQTF
ncbi:MAG: hypothetical protein H0U59_09105 [Gemmatimonadaceae bacterium]|nr:hypothetical protein [Gemmatimonadaceae bacterium]